MTINGASVTQKEQSKYCNKANRREKKKHQKNTEKNIQNELFIELRRTITQNESADGHTKNVSKHIKKKKSQSKFYVALLPEYASNCGDLANPKKRI